MRNAALEPDVIFCYRYSADICAFQSYLALSKPSETASSLCYYFKFLFIFHYQVHNESAPTELCKAEFNEIGAPIIQKSLNIPCHLVLVLMHILANLIMLSAANKIVLQLL